MSQATSYLMRQLYDMKHGIRAGVLANLSNADFTAIAAYAASLDP